METKVLYLVIPCFNEEAALPITAQLLFTKVKSLIKRKIVSNRSRVVFINDGSSDKTWNIIEDLIQYDDLYGGINLSKNFGHQNALLAGLMSVKEKCDMCISLDADLQDDLQAIDEMIKEFYNGFDVVYGVRNTRDKDTWFKRNSALLYYKTLDFLGTKIVNNHADYRLLSKRALLALEEFREVNLFLRGIIPMVGFPSTKVFYKRNERIAGESKYPLKKMLGFAFEGITSLSVKPIRLITMLGLSLSAFSIFMSLYTLFQHFLGKTNSGWSSLMLSIWFLGGLILFSVGVVGEYIGKIYLETKSRPRFVIQDCIIAD